MKYQFDILLKYLLFCYLLPAMFTLFSPNQVRYEDTSSGTKSSGSLMDYKIQLYTSPLLLLFEGPYVSGS